MPRRTLLPLIALIVVLAIGLAWLVRVGVTRPDGGASLPVLRARADPDPAPPEPVQLTAAEKEIPSETPQAKVNPSLVAPDEVGFLPYPNGGEAAFKHKYEGLDLRALGGTMLLLQGRLNAEVDHLVEDRYAHGLFDEKIYPSEKEANSDSQRSDPPAGMGKVWPCERGTLQPDGFLQRWTTVLSEAEYPELFAHKAEYEWVVLAHWHKNQAAEGH